MASVLQSPISLSFGIPHKEMIVHDGQQNCSYYGLVVVFGESYGEIAGERSIELTRFVGNIPRRKSIA